MAQGTVKWYNAEKGYGFIAPDDGGEDVFLYHKMVQWTQSFRVLCEGQRVSFEVTEGQKGPMAAKVTLEGYSQENSGGGPGIDWGGVLHRGWEILKDLND